MPTVRGGKEHRSNITAQRSRIGEFSEICILDSAYTFTTEATEASLLRSSREWGVGVGLGKWMVVLLPARPLEKSASGFENTSIHRLVRNLYASAHVRDRRR